MPQLAVSDSKNIDLSYTPGDLTEPSFRLPSHQQLLNEKNDSKYGLDQELPLKHLYLDNEDCKLTSTSHPARARVISAAERRFPDLAAAQASYAGCLNSSSSSNNNSASDLVHLSNVKSIQLPTPKNFLLTSVADPDLVRNMPLHSITEKPNERCPSPVVPAYANFEMAKRMHQNNLDHQPLPDCIADLAFRKAQISGGHAGLALDIDPIATGVGIKTHNVGPTHCTKLKVFRPKTGAGCLLPKSYAGYRDIGSAPIKKMGAMDLAICWDYKPADPADEPRRTNHIDGSNDSAGPAVFTCVKTPRADSGTEPGRAAGVFNSTLGEADFFDKDILRRKMDFGGQHIEREQDCACDFKPLAPRARSVSRDSSAARCRRGVNDAHNDDFSFGELGNMPNRIAKQYQSTPMLADKTYQALREKYLGPETTGTGGCAGASLSMEHGCRRQAGSPGCKQDMRSLFRRPGGRRLCHKVAPAPKCCPQSFGHCTTNKAAFRAGVPRHNAVGDFVGVEDAFDTVGSRVLVVPRPRNPYSKKNYDIDTLVPPFRSQGGGAGQGGYPEHWRLASVYQHAYKPLDQRRRPLLQTVYK